MLPGERRMRVRGRADRAATWQNCGGPVERRENGRIEIYYPPVRGREYVIGVDPAGGGSEGDYAAAQVVDRASGLQCAELRGHYTPVELASAGGATRARI